MPVNKANIAILTGIFLFLQISYGQIGVQRSTSSSYFEYQKYLSQSKNQSFVRSYLDLAKLKSVETISLNQCLENLFLEKQSDEICFEAVKGLASQPLNDSSREVLISFLKKLKKFPSQYQKIYLEFEKGFSITHPQMASRFGSLQTIKNSPEVFSKLEMNAWKKLIEKKLMLSESLLLVNGEIIKDLKNWLPPSGVFQWALISNTHEPMIRICSFSQFAGESIQELKAFSNQHCENSEKKEIKTFGLTRTQIFYSRNCVIEKDLLAMSPKSQHLGDIPTNLKMISPDSKRHWIFPALVVLGLGVAYQLKGKNVSLTMPGF